jgi:hypothetical protein
MICEKCGGQVEWKGPLTALTHTQCLNCGAINSQVIEIEEDKELDRDKAEHRAHTRAFDKRS